MIWFYQIQNVNALMKTIQPKKQQRQQLQHQQLPLVSVTVLFIHVDGLGMAIVMTAQTIWIAILMVEIAVVPMLTQTIVQVRFNLHNNLTNLHRNSVWYIACECLDPDVGTEFSCKNLKPTKKCKKWKNQGKCNKNWAKEKCAKTCGECWIQEWSPVSLKYDKF